MSLLIRRLSYAVEGREILKELDLEVLPGELFFLLGSSGCGKTTLIRLIAGFADPTHGEIYLKGRLLNSVPIQDRETALVFQNYALWPHMTVGENVAFGLQQRKIKAPEIEHRVSEILTQIRLSDHKDRYPPQLSGGQQQRVSLARALVVRPQLLMLDEPLSNLDARLRLEIRQEVMRLHRQHEMTSLYVTHDQEEALSMADRIAILNQGRIEQIGTPREIYESPQTEFVAKFFGEINEYVGATSPLAKLLGASDSEKVLFRPESVQIVGNGSGLPVQVAEISYRGKETLLTVETEDRETLKVMTTSSFKPGDSLEIDLAEKALFRFPCVL